MPNEKTIENDKTDEQLADVRDTIPEPLPRKTTVVEIVSGEKVLGEKNLDEDWDPPPKSA